MEVAAKPRNYLALSIVNMLCCCFILGLIALVFSLQVYTFGPSGPDKLCMAAACRACI